MSSGGWGPGASGRGPSSGRWDDPEDMPARPSSRRGPPVGRDPRDPRDPRDGRDGAREMRASGAAARGRAATGMLTIGAPPRARVGAAATAARWALAAAPATTGVTRPEEDGARVCASQSAAAAAHALRRARTCGRPRTRAGGAGMTPPLSVLVVMGMPLATARAGQRRRVGAADSGATKAGVLAARLARPREAVELRAPARCAAARDVRAGGMPMRTRRPRPAKPLASRSAPSC
jgi:hypothetical protein